MESIAVSMGHCLTIMFINTKLDQQTPQVWVCADVSEFRNACGKLEKMPHIRIIQSGLTVFKG